MCQVMEPPSQFETPQLSHPEHRTLQNMSSHRPVNEDLPHVTPGRCVPAAIESHPLIMLNDNKAGMGGLDKDRINKIIDEASKGSKFYENERRKEAVLSVRIREQQAVVDSLTSSQIEHGLQQANQIMRELQESRDLSHTIVHVDMDAFYAAVEIRDDPSLRDKPVAVGGMGMLSTSNYIARRFGIRAAMPGFIARKLCPDLIIVPTNFDKYISVSETVRQILAEYDPNFLPMSLDEAYLDFTEHLCSRINSPSSSRTFILRTSETNSALCACDLNLVLRPMLLRDKDLHSLQQAKNDGSYDTDQISYSDGRDHSSGSSGKEVLSGVAEGDLTTCHGCKKLFPPYRMEVYGESVEEAVREMRNRIEQRTNLTASAGIAPNMMLAKICSDRNKPNGQFRVMPDKDEVEQFISGLPVRKIPGIGKVTEKQLEALGVITCRDLYQHRAVLYNIFMGKSFHSFMSIAAGIGSTTIERDVERKSMSTEQTFGKLVSPGQLINKCKELCQRLANDLRVAGLEGKTVTLKIKTVDFLVKTRASTISHYSSEHSAIFAAARQLLETEMQAVPPGALHLRLMGVRMSKLRSQSKIKTSVASYFMKQSQKSPATDPASSQRYPFLDTSGHHGDLRPRVSSMATADSHFLQDQHDDDDDDDDEYCEIVEYEDAPSKPCVSLTQEGSRAHKKKFDKQKTIANFLCSRNGSQVSMGRNNGSPYTRSGLDDGLVIQDVSDDDVSLGLSHKRSGLCDSLDIQDLTDEYVSLGCESPLIQNSSARVHGPHITSKKDLLAPASGNEETISLVSETEDRSEFSAGGQTSEASLMCGGMVHCPVCGQQRYKWPLDELNVHLDMCLNRVAIRDIITDKQSDHHEMLLSPASLDQQCKTLQSSQQQQKLSLSPGKQGKLLLSPTSGKRARTETTRPEKVDKRSKTQPTLFSFFKP